MLRPDESGVSESKLLDRLALAFQDEGWKVDAALPGIPRSDLLVRKGARAYAVELKLLARKPERALLQPLLAAAILEARAGARDLDAAPLAVVAAAHLSPGLISALESYADEVAADVAWGAMDARGRIVLHGPGLEGIGSAASPRPRRGGRRLPAGRRMQDPFSDLGQWMIKVLIAPSVPEEWLGAPRAPLHRVQDLADAARVSMPSASKLLSALGARSFVERGDEEIRVVRKRALLDSWRSAAARPLVELPCAFLGGVELQGMLADHAARHEHSDASPFEQAGPHGERVCLALFSACRALGLGFVRGAPEHVYAERIDPEFLEELGVFPVEHPAQAEVFVRRPKFPEAVFRACVVRDGVPAADALQCWLDVSVHPARGAEQAEEILSRLKLD